MPRLDGRRPTRKTVLLDEAKIGSFAVEGMDRIRDTVKCHARGCDHRVVNCFPQGRYLPAWVVHEDRIDDVIGLACTCCVLKIVGS